MFQLMAKKHASSSNERLMLKWNSSTVASEKRQHHKKWNAINFNNSLASGSASFPFLSLSYQCKRQSEVGVSFLQAHEQAMRIDGCKDTRFQIENEEEVEKESKHERNKLHTSRGIAGSEGVDAAGILSRNYCRTKMSSCSPSIIRIDIINEILVWTWTFIVIDISTDAGDHRRIEGRRKNVVNS